MSERATTERCRRCGGETGPGDYVHHVWLTGEEGAREVALWMCAPCGGDFADARARDEYTRLVLLG